MLSSVGLTVLGFRPLCVASQSCRAVADVGDTDRVLQLTGECERPEKEKVPLSSNDTASDSPASGKEKLPKTSGQGGNRTPDTRIFSLTSLTTVHSCHLVLRLHRRQF
jgi:hypothetical protein